MKKARIRGSLPGVLLVACCAGALAQTAAPPIAEPPPPSTPASPPPAKPAPQTDASLASTPAAAANVPSTPAPGAPSAPQAHDNVRTATSPLKNPETAMSPPSAVTANGSPAVAPPTAPVVVGPPGVPSRFRPPKLGWDINLEGAYGRYFPASEGLGFARFRGGLLYSSDPIFYALGLTYEWSNLEVATFGVQAEVMQIETGLWLQLGGLMDAHAHPGAMAAVGWSILGAELQLRKFDPDEYGFAAVAKLRIPVTFIAQAF
ncbi:MAG: hypothetical protein ACM3ZE_13760 [Myxococcales bacterium]